MLKASVRYTCVTGTLWFCLALPACGERRLGADNDGHASAKRRRTASPAKVDADAAAGAGRANQSGESPEDRPTFWQNVKPIFDAKCGRCHREGGIGSFELATYASAYEHRMHIRAAVVSRHMPPWLAADGCDDYANDARLSDSQIETIANWVEEGAPEGDPASPGPAVDSGQPLKLSRVDLSLTMAAPYTQAVEPDELRCFVLDWPEATTRYVTGFAARPGNSQTVHHAIAYAASPEELPVVEALDANAPGEGYPCYGSTGFQGRWVGVWEPNGMGADLPEGRGVRIDPGSKIVVQMHYNAENLVMGTDQSSFDFKLEDVVEQEAYLQFFTRPEWTRGQMPITAGEALVTHEWEADLDWLTAGRPIDVYVMGTHQHQLGISSHVSLRTTRGESDCLLDIPHWRWHWQNSHQFKEPKRINPGDRLRLKCQWDNSADHQRIVDGIRLPPKDVNWGEGASDEMCVAAFVWSFAGD